MNNKLALSIAITSLASIGAVSLPVHAADTAPAPQADAKAPPKKTHGGKCASGKCGTEKIYAKVALDKNPQDKRLSWRHGIGKNVLDKKLRVSEVANWIEFQVLPMRVKRGRG